MICCARFSVYIIQLSIYDSFMPKIDARTFDRKKLLTVHKKVIALYEQQVPMMKIVGQTGLSHPAVKRVINRYENGDSINELQKPGRKKGTGRTLTPEQEGEIRNILYSRRPWQVKLKHTKRSIKLSVWNRGAVQELIGRYTEKPLSSRTIAKYMARWGFPSIQQHKQPLNQCSLEIQGWVNQNREYIDSITPAEVFWVSTKQIKVDKNDPMMDQYKWRKTMSIASAIDIYGKEHWLVFKGELTKKRQIEFLKALSDQSAGMCICIRNNADYYTHRDVLAWLEEHSSATMVLPPSIQTLI